MSQLERFNLRREIARRAMESRKLMYDKNNIEIGIAMFYAGCYWSEKKMWLLIADLDL